MGVPQYGWFQVENHIKMDDLEVPPFQETSMCSSQQPSVLTGTHQLTLENLEISEHTFTRIHTGETSRRFHQLSAKWWKHGSPLELPGCERRPRWTPNRPGRKCPPLHLTFFRKTGQKCGTGVPIDDLPGYQVSFHPDSSLFLESCANEIWPRSHGKCSSQGSV